MTHPLDLALSLNLNGQFDAGEDILKPLAEQGDPRAIFNLGWHHMRHGRFLEGMKGLTYGRELNCFGLPPLKTDKPIWNGESLTGKKLLFRCEGGYGDQITFLRFAETFRFMGTHVTVSCSREMFPLFRTVKWIDGLIDNSSAQAADFDYWVPAMSAPLVLGCEYDDLSGKPFIDRPEALPLSGKLKVGLRWAGNPKFEHEQHRKFPVELMTSLADIDATFYSLQRDNDMIDLPKGISDLSPFMSDWLATAKIIAGLDLVISSCTATAHLAAAMGIETWIIVPILPYYMWALTGEKSPWYDSATIFRQEEYGDWKAPFEQITGLP